MVTIASIGSTKRSDKYVKSKIIIKKLDILIFFPYNPQPDGILASKAK